MISCSASTLRTSISDAHVVQFIGQSATPNLETSPTSPTVPGDPLAPMPAAVTSTEHDQVSQAQALRRITQLNTKDHQPYMAELLLRQAAILFT